MRGWKSCVGGGQEVGGFVALQARFCKLQN